MVDGSCLHEVYKISLSTKDRGRWLMGPVYMRSIGSHSGIEYKGQG